MKTLGLNGRDQYALFSALRGPDPGQRSLTIVEEALKSNVTARVRAIVFEADECAGMYTQWPLDEADITEIGFVLKHASYVPSYEHYIYHLYLAIVVTMDHPVWGGRGGRLADMLFRYVHECADIRRWA